MPKLIRYERQATPQNQTGVVQQARRSFDEPGMGDVVKLAADVVGRIEESRAQGEATRAVLATREALTKYERDLAAQDLFSGDLEPMFKARAEEILREQSDRIKSGAARNAFQAQADQLKSEYGLRVDDMARRKSADEARALTVEVQDIYAGLASDPLSSEDDVMEAYEGFRSLLVRQQANGIYSKEDAAIRLAQADDTLSTYRHNRHVENIDIMLESGQYLQARDAFAAAEKAGEILPEKRDDLEKRIQGITVEVKSLEIVDPISERVRSGDISAAEARAELRNISDPIQRKAAREELDYQIARIESDSMIEKRAKAERKAAEAEMAGDYYSDWDMKIRQGGSVSQIPRDQWALMTPAMRSNLTGLKPGAVKPVTDLTAYDEFYTIFADPDAEPSDVVNFLNQNAGRFTVEDYRSLRAKAASLKPDPAKQVITDPRTLTQVVSSTLAANGIDDPKDRGVVLDAYSRWDMAFEETYNRSPTDQERQEEIDRLVLRTKLPGQSRSQRAYNVTSLKRSAGVTNEAHQPIVARFFAGSERKIKTAQIKATYEAALGILAEAGINNPNEVQLTQALSRASIMMNEQTQ